MEHSAVLLTGIKLPNRFKTFVLPIFEWLLKNGFTVFMRKLSILASTLASFFTQNSVINQICYTGFASGFWSMHMHKINTIPASMSVNEHGKF